MTREKRRYTAVFSGFCLALGASGCKRLNPDSGHTAGQPSSMSQAVAAPVAAEKWFTPVAQQAPGLHLAYEHQVTLEVPKEVLANHFFSARDKCLNTPVLHCLLLNAELGSLPPTPVQSAALRMRLPHDQIAGFSNGLTDPLQGEKPGEVVVIRQSTTAEDIGQPLADVGQRVAQLQDYLTSLKALGGRLTISVSDLVKIAAETSQAQTKIEAAQAEQRSLALRADTEELDIDFQSQFVAAQQADPINEVFSDGETIFRSNLADALRVAIAAVPWIPVALVGLFLLWVVTRLIFGRRAPSPSPAVRESL